MLGCADAWLLGCTYRFFSRCGDFSEPRRTVANTNNDSQLSLEEYKPLWIERHNRRIVRSFQFLDANGNGQVSDAEFRRVIDWVVARMDRDEDGAISKDDFKRRHR